MPRGWAFKRPVPESLALFSVPEPNTGCILWLGSLDGSGYGMLRHDGRTRRAHRLAWEAVNGSIPEGLQLDHLCRVRSCVNVKHLEIVTPLENWLRGFNPCRRNIRKTHCYRGHPFNDENTYRMANGWRRCLACQRINHKKLDEKRKAYGRR